MNRRTLPTYPKHAEMQCPPAVRASVDPGVVGGSDESGDGGGIASSSGGPAAAPGKLRRIYRDFAKGGSVGHDTDKAKDGKLTKASVDYSVGMGSHRCRNCTHFNPDPKSCDVTSSAGAPTPGRIDPRYWCKKFEAKRHFAEGGPVLAGATKGAQTLMEAMPEIADKVLNILKPSRLKEVRDHILDNAGAAQAKRFDQANDTANLSRFSNNALKKAFYPGESGLFTTLRPSSFEDYAARLPVGIEDYYPYIRGVADMKSAGLKPTYDNYMDHLAGIMTDPKKGAASLPTLWLRSDRFTPFPEIAGHEGRHRMRSMAERLGDHDSLVALLPDKGSLPYDPEIAKAAMLERYFPGGPDTLFTPQWDNDAESIGEARDMLPFVNPVFAKGGAVDMAGGGSALEKLARKAIKVFHGSPHVFDKFDSSKIGTGEGAQVYGHGLYFAESPKVANYYRNTLAGNRPNWLDASGNIIDPGTIKDRMFRAAGFDGDQLLLDAIQSGDPNAEKLWWDTKPLRDTINKAFSGISMGNDPSHYTGQFPDDTRLSAAIDHLVNNYTRRKPGATYEVSLFHDPAMMLNLDRKIDEQPDILQDALRTLGERFTRATTGGDVLNVLEDKYGPRDTALRLADRGITGTRFWDQNSRGFGNRYEDMLARGEPFTGSLVPTRNYVSFPGFDDLIEIDKQYAKGGVVTGDNPPTFDFQTPVSAADALPPASAYAEGGAVDMAGGGSASEKLLARLAKWIGGINFHPVAVATPEDALPHVLSDRRYKSQFETGTSEGLLAPENRSITEYRLFDTPPGIAPSLRPIYGHVLDPDEIHAASTYGPWKAILNERVKPRSTFTLGDSLGEDKSIYGPYRFESHESPRNKLHIDTYGDANPYWRDHLARLESDKLSDLIKRQDYVEAQIHGGLPLDDVNGYLYAHRWNGVPEDPDEVQRFADDSGKLFFAPKSEFDTPNETDWLKYTPGSAQARPLDFEDMWSQLHYAEGGAVDMAGGGSALEKLAKLGKRLLGVHNTTPHRIDMMETLGGNPVPSIAVVDPAHGFNSFGDISLVGDPKLVTPSRTTPVFGADVYSPRFPPLNDEGTKIFRGFDDEGNRRYAKLTLPNVVREMKGNIRGGEGGNYGAGKVRAMVTPQFKDLLDIRANDWRLVSNDEFSKLRTKANNDLVDLAQDFYPHWKYAGNPLQHSDDFSSMLGDYANNLDRLRDHYKPLPEGYLGRVQDYMSGLRDMPTEYFEAKPQRAVDLSEFKHAVIPSPMGYDGSDYDRAAQILKDHGLDVTHYSKGMMGDRLERDAILRELVPDLGFAEGGAVDYAGGGHANTWMRPVGNVLGSIVGGIYGGPWGSMAGGKAGATLGTGLGDLFGGKTDMLDDDFLLDPLKEGLGMLGIKLAEGGPVPERNDYDPYDAIQDALA